jgi:hypothetical protein
VRTPVGETHAGGGMAEDKLASANV